MFIGSILFRFFGVLLRWVVINMWSLLRWKRGRVRFIDVWSGKQNNDFFSATSYETSNIIIGFVFVLTMCAILFFLKV